MATHSKAGRAKRGADEMTAMTVVYTALKPLKPETQRWILRSLIDRFALGVLGGENGASPSDVPAVSHVPEVDIAEPLPRSEQKQEPPSDPAQGTSSTATSGISPVAQRWMVRSNLTSAQLGSIYSLNFDNIDLVSPSVPGKSIRNRMRGVLLLKCIASYLASGAARVSHEDAKEACIHYKAYDLSNFARYLKEMAREISGAKESGYSLTATGMAAATELIRAMIANPSQATARAAATPRRARRAPRAKAPAKHARRAAAKR